MRSLTEVLLLLTVFLLPLLGPGNLGFEQTKVYFFIQMTTVSFILWLLTLKDKKVKLSWDNISKLAAIFVTILLLTSLIGVNPSSSILGKQPYLQGWILYFSLFLFSLVVSSAKIKFKNWAICLSVSSFLVSFVAIMQWSSLHLLHQNIPTYAGRVVSTFGQPNLYAGFILLTLPFIFSLASNSKFKWWARLAILASIAAIFISQSRAAIIILLAILFIWWVNSLTKVLKRVILAASTTLILGAIIISIVSSSGLIWTELKDPKDQWWLINNSPEKRVYIWQVSVELIKEEPFLGYGLENFDQAFSAFFKNTNFNYVTNPVYYSLRNVYVDRAHSYPFDLLIFSGLLGLLSWLTLIWLLFRQCKLPVLKISLLIYLIWVSVQIQSVVHLLFFWTILGITNQKS